MQGVHLWRGGAPYQLWTGPSHLAVTILEARAAQRLRAGGSAGRAYGKKKNVDKWGEPPVSARVGAKESVASRGGSDRNCSPCKRATEARADSALYFGQSDGDEEQRADVRDLSGCSKTSQRLVLSQNRSIGRSAGVYRFACPYRCCCRRCGSFTVLVGRVKSPPALPARNRQAPGSCVPSQHSSNCAGMSYCHACA